MKPRMHTGLARAVLIGVMVALLGFPLNGLTLTADIGAAADASSEKTVAAPPVVASEQPSVTSSAMAESETMLTPEQISDAVVAAVKDASAGTDLGFVIYDKTADETLASVDADEPYYTASMVKLLIALEVLHTGGWHAPDAATAESLEDMLAGSNDSVASRWWVDYGGTSLVDKMADLIGLRNTVAPSDPGQWGMTKMSANDVVRVYRYLLDVVPDEASGPILDALGDAREVADDGYPQYFGIPDALSGTQWAVKQGWMTLKSSLVLNTTGIVDSRYVVSLFTEQPRGVGSTEARSAVTAGITAAQSVLTGPSSGR